MKTVNIIIETPGGSRAKYNYDEKKEKLFVKKLLPAGMVFPYDFGFIPDTKGDDGDPIDAMVIAEFNTFPGCEIECRIIGALLAEQKENGKTIRNDRFFFVPTHSLFFSKVNNLSQLSEDHLKQLQDFFINYNTAEEKEFTPLQIIEAEDAWTLLKKQKA